MPAPTLFLFSRLPIRPLQLKFEKRGFALFIWPGPRPGASRGEKKNAPWRQNRANRCCETLRPRPADRRFSWPGENSDSRKCNLGVELDRAMPISPLVRHPLCWPIPALEKKSEYRANLWILGLVRVGYAISGSRAQRIEECNANFINRSFVNSPEAPMAVKNMQTVVMCVAKTGVRVTGLECGSMQARSLEAPFLSLPWQPLPGYPSRPAADRFAADNAATATAVHRTGRSVSGVGRIIRHAVLSTRPSHAFAKRMAMQRG